MSLQKDSHTLQTNQTLPAKDIQSLQLHMELLVVVNQYFVS